MKVKLNVWVEVGNIGSSGASPLLERIVDLPFVPIVGMVITDTMGDPKSVFPTIEFTVDEASFDLSKEIVNAWYTDKSIVPGGDKHWTAVASDESVQERIADWTNHGWKVKP